MKAVHAPMHPTKCSICGGPIDVKPGSGWAGGNNAQPINDGRCCTTCDETLVVPLRIALMKKQARGNSNV
jgi:hypothetical protein